MASKKTTSSKSATKNKRRTSKEEINQANLVKKISLSLVFSLILLLGLIRLGRFGVTIYNLLRLVFGSLSYLAILGILTQIFASKWLKRHEGVIAGFWTIFSGLLINWHAFLFFPAKMTNKPIFSTTTQLLLNDLMAFRVQKFVGGGLLGSLFYMPISFLFSNIGSFFIGGLLIALGIFLMTPWDLYDIMEFSSQSWAKQREKAELARQKRFIKKEEKRLLLLQQEEEALLAVEQELEPEGLETSNPLFTEENQAPSSGREVEIYLPDEQVEKTWEEFDNQLPVPIFEDEDEEVYDIDFDLDLPIEDNFHDAMSEPLVPFSTIKHQLLYKLPSIDLFAPDKPKNQSKEKKIVRENIKILEQTFASFGIKATVERAEIGPSVTKYEVKPATGVRVNRISNLADDLALALAAKDVRIEAPIPGKSVIGIEVPNAEIATVSFRELWEQAQTNPDNLLEVPLGKAVNGSSRSFDLARMPHLLVAGSTGSGKSVAVNGIISSILMKARPDQVKFMMIDPKMVELSVYNDIPHLLIPVVTNPRKASKALQKVVDEMENRYELFSKVGVRNIAGYNAKVESWNKSNIEKQIPLPLLVVIVDELADLMMVASKEVEDAIIRLGQKARAAGIHMILATQRPSVDVISGLIKANVPSRIAFAVSSGTDSRTILDTAGAEKLLGRGDMLFKPIDENHPVRLQGSFISDDDVERIVGFIKAQAEADYDDSFDPGEVAEDDSSGNSGAAQGDPLFEEAKNLIIETKKASASMLQRRLSIGFNRASDLLNELEQAGVIGPAEGTKPRKVLITS